MLFAVFMIICGVFSLACLPHFVFLSLKMMNGLLFFFVVGIL